MRETTALGAAIAAGLAVGIWMNFVPLTAREGLFSNPRSPNIKDTNSLPAGRKRWAYACAAAGRTKIQSRAGLMNTVIVALAECPGRMSAAPMYD
jgi:glycerol kinase